MVMDHAAHEVDVRLRVRRLAAFAASSSESSREGSPGAPACRTTASAPSSAASSESAQPPSRAAAARATTTQRVPNRSCLYPSEGSGSHTGLARVHCWGGGSHEEVSPGAARRGSGHAQTGRFLCGVLLLMGVLTASASAQLPDPNDPRVGLAPGLENPGVADQGMDLLAHVNKSAGWFDPANPGNFGFVNLRPRLPGRPRIPRQLQRLPDHDISEPSGSHAADRGRLPWRSGRRVGVQAPAVHVGRGDACEEGLHVHAGGRRDHAFPRRPHLRHQQLDAPEQVGQVQTCRGSHTHTLVTDKHNKKYVYIYVQGTAGVRPPEELAGCDANNTNTPTGDNPSKWRIEIIKVPLAAPEDAEIVNEPRLRGSGHRRRQRPPERSADAEPSVRHGLGPDADHGRLPRHHRVCEVRDRGGRLQGNGLLIDISNPAKPKRIDAVADPLYAYWHGATFSNDGKTVVFTDEWGGGTAARCRATDQLSWGNDLRHRPRQARLPQLLQDPAGPDDAGELRQPHPVAGPGAWARHLRPGVVPGRRVAGRLQRLEQPVEIGYYDRGPISSTSLVLGLWSTYWYNGATYGSEIARGFDVAGLTRPTRSENEIEAAEEVPGRPPERAEPGQARVGPSFAVVRSFVVPARALG